MFLTYIHDEKWISEDGWKVEIQPYFDLKLNQLWLYQPAHTVDESGLGEIEYEEMWYRIVEVIGYYPTTYQVEQSETNPPDGLLPIGLKSAQPA